MTDELKPPVTLTDLAQDLPTPFEPPEGWTFMARNMAEVIVGGQIAMDDPVLAFVGQLFEAVSKTAAIRCYIYPQMVLCMVWSPPNGVWIGNAISREVTLGS